MRCFHEIFALEFTMQCNLEITVWKSENFFLTLFSQKFRESNGCLTKFFSARENFHALWYSTTSVEKWEFYYDSHRLYVKSCYCNSCVKWFHELLRKVVKTRPLYSVWHLFMQFYVKMIAHSEPVFSKMAKHMNKQKILLHSRQYQGKG